MEAPKDVRQLIAENRTEEAIKTLQQLAINLGNQDVEDQLILLLGRYNKDKKDELQGLKTDKDIQLSNSRLNNALLSLDAELSGNEGVVQSSKLSDVSLDQPIKKWSHEGELLDSFEGSNASITSLSVADNFVLSTDRKGNVGIYENGKSIIRDANPSSTASAAIFVPEGNNKVSTKSRAYLVGTQEGIIQTLRLHGKVLGEVNLGSGPINSLAISPDSDKILVATNDQSAILYTRGTSNSLSFGQYGNLARIGPFGRENDEPFLHLLPPGARLISLTVNSDKLIDHIKMKYRVGKQEEELIIGDANAEDNEKFYINAPITKITGRADYGLDQLQFHFADGTKTPVYGSGDGKPFAVNYDNMEFAGFHGQAGRGRWISQLGFFGLLQEEQSSQ